MTPAYRDFLASLGSRQLNFASPIPEIVTVWNAIIHEYCVVRQATGSPKFQELDFGNYMQALSIGVMWMEDPAKRKQAQEILASHGWKGPTELQVRSTAYFGAFLFRPVGRLWSAFIRRTKIGSCFAQRGMPSIMPSAFPDCRKKGGDWNQHRLCRIGRSSRVAACS